MKINHIGHAWSKTMQETKRLRLQPKQRFIFFHNPKNWEIAEFKDGKKSIFLLLPSLNSLILEAGINGVRAQGKSIDYSIAVANLQSSGCTVLLPENHDYLVRYPVHLGMYYTTKFEVLEEIAGTIIKSFDDDAFNEFKRNLVLNGDIELPHDHFIRLIENSNDNTINRLSSDLHNPAVKARYEKLLLFQKQVKQAKERIKKQGVKGYELRRSDEKNN